MVFCGNNEVKAFVQQEIEKIPDEWLQRMDLILVRPQNAQSSFYKTLQPKIRSMTMFDDLDSLKAQCPFMNFQ